jgi:hypothetical protein
MGGIMIRKSRTKLIGVFLPTFLLVLALCNITSSGAQPEFVVFFDDLIGFNNAASSPPVIISFDDIAAGTNITGSTIGGVTFEVDPLVLSAPLLVVRANDTHSLPGYSPPATDNNTLNATSGDNILSPGGVDLAPGPNVTVENDDIILSFTNPVFAVGFDVLFQSMDPYSFTSVKVLNQTGSILYFQDIPTPTGNEAFGGTVFVGFVSNSSNIAKIIIDDGDNNAANADNNIGLDTIRLRISPPTAPSSPRNLIATPGNGQVILAWDASADDGGSAITNYIVYRSSTESGTYSPIASPTGLTYTDTGLTNGQTYYYKVSANNSAGEGILTERMVAIPAASSPSGGGDMTLIIAIVGLVAAAGIGSGLFFIWKKKKKK